MSSVPRRHLPGFRGRADRQLGLSFQTYIHIIDQRTRKPVATKLYTDAMVVFHHVNAYEEGDCVLFDVIAYEDNSLYQMFYLANLNQDFEENCRLTSVPTLRRFAVPLHVDKVKVPESSCFFLGTPEPRRKSFGTLFD